MAKLMLAFDLRSPSIMHLKAFLVGTFIECALYGVLHMASRVKYPFPHDDSDRSTPNLALIPLRDLFRHILRSVRFRDGDYLHQGNHELLGGSSMPRWFLFFNNARCCGLPNLPGASSC